LNMSNPVVTLTTDFGEDSPYVAAMKGVILATNAAARIVDLSHQTPAQDVRYASFFLAASLPYFPAGTLHVVVVDPGVGSERAILYAELGGQRILAPDNGCLTGLVSRVGEPTVVRKLEETGYWRPTVSSTFHGRDIFAPVAGHLSLGLDPARLGPLFANWLRLEEAQPIRGAMESHGEVVFVDHFGNLISNIPADAVSQPPQWLQVGKRRLKRFAWVRSYAEARPGDLVVLVSSENRMEVAVAQGNAAKRLRAGVGTSISVGFDA
jgi:S-adenosylmethionine hydrolase